MEKRTVIVLVIIAVVLAGLAIGVGMIDSGESVSINVPAGMSADRDGGNVGLVINTPDIEDRGTP